MKKTLRRSSALRKTDARYFVSSRTRLSSTFSRTYDIVLRVFLLISIHFKAPLLTKKAKNKVCQCGNICLARCRQISKNHTRANFSREHRARDLRGNYYYYTELYRTEMRDAMATRSERLIPFSRLFAFRRELRSAEFLIVKA